MRLNEFIIVYLATAAPVGMVSFLRHQTHVSASVRTRMRALVIASIWALIWPIAIVRDLLRNRHRQANRVSKHLQDAFNDDAALTLDGDVERAERSLQASLRDVDEFVKRRFGPSADLQNAVFVARNGAERYAGLSLAVMQLNPQGNSVTAVTEREVELCRIAGRAGDDLLVAGNCVRRRNVSRLIAHHRNARTSLLHALADVCEEVSALGVDHSRTVQACDQGPETVVDVLRRSVDRFPYLMTVNLRPAQHGCSTSNAAACAKWWRNPLSRATRASCPIR